MNGVEVVLVIHNVTKTVILKMLSSTLLYVYCTKALHNVRELCDMWHRCLILQTHFINEEVIFSYTVTGCYNNSNWRAVHTVSDHQMFHWTVTTSRSYLIVKPHLPDSKFGGQRQHRLPHGPKILMATWGLNKKKKKKKHNVFVLCAGVHHCQSNVCAGFTTHSYLILCVHGPHCWNT